MNIEKNQFGLQQGKFKIDTILLKKQYQEKYLAKKKKLHRVFVDLERVLTREHRI